MSDTAGAAPVVTLRRHEWRSRAWVTVRLGAPSPRRGSTPSEEGLRQLGEQMQTPPASREGVAGPGGSGDAGSGRVANEAGLAALGEDMHRSAGDALVGGGRRHAVAVSACSAGAA